MRLQGILNMWPADLIGHWTLVYTIFVFFCVPGEGNQWEADLQQSGE